MNQYDARFPMRSDNLTIMTEIDIADDQLSHFISDGADFLPRPKGRGSSLKHLN
ncbi:MAG: hypothetical protein LZF64_00580 [Nitrosomonas sp.]|nr:MAG: hypothetical protein LZF64_00580 [Nitrosomonas sp.]